MPCRKGFTLIEIIAVLIIAGTLAAIAIPNYFTFMEQGTTQNAVNNLTIILNAQKIYYYNNGSYCLYGAQSICGDLGGPNGLNAELHLNIPDDNAFTYECTTGGSPSSIYCYAFRYNPLYAYTLQLDSSKPIKLTGNNRNPFCFNACPSWLKNS